MLSCKRANNWRFKAITFAIVGSISWLLFYTLRLGLQDGTADYNAAGKYGYTIFRAATLRFENSVGEYSQFTQFKDFIQRNFITQTDREVTTVYNNNNNNNNKKQKKTCTKLDDCFNFDRCNSGFYIYLYPFADNQFLSVMYGRILEAIKNSVYITDDPRLACIFILSLDTLDRDKLSNNFVKDLHKKISKLSYWNNGENHLILNMFSGTWPDYLDDLSFDYGKAIIAKASFSYNALRTNYDISIPLLPKNFPLRNGLFNKNNVHLFPKRRKYLLVFKGKRYLHGIGSETRNSLYLIDNNDDIVLLTSCRHGKNWEKMKDDRCDEDNKKYDSYDYVDLLSNSTYCLIPRGRRLGSFRLLEAMEYGCIPIILSNGWALPLAEVIDWSKFAIVIDERLLLQIPSIVRSISNDEVLARRQQTLFIWDKYFSSIEKVMSSMIELLRERIQPNLKRHHLMWNSSPGALKVNSEFSSSPLHYPFYNNIINNIPSKKFTAIILAVSPVYRSSSPLFQLIKAINLSEFVDQILVVWLPSVGIPDKARWPRTKVTLRVIHPPKKDMNMRYVHMGLAKTDAVFTFDEDVIINTSEIDFAFSVWKSNPTRLVGFSTGSHYYNANNQRWNYTSSFANEYSVIRMSSAISHRYFSHYYTERSPAGLHELVKREKNCESLAMNFVASYVSGEPPIKVARSAQFKDGALTKRRLDVTFTELENESTEQRCFQELIRIFSELPLVSSKLSFNPVLYKDLVSISRKKYKTLG